MIPLVVLIMTLCVQGECHSERLWLERVPLAMCVAHGPIIVAQYLLDRPGVVITGWRCVEVQA